MSKETLRERVKNILKDSARTDGWNWSEGEYVDICSEQIEALIQSEVKAAKLELLERLELHTTREEPKGEEWEYRTGSYDMRDTIVKLFLAEQAALTKEQE